MTWRPDPFYAIPRAVRPWYGRWWAIGGLVLAVLLLGTAAYGATRIVADRAGGDQRWAGPVGTADPGGGAAATTPPATTSPVPAGIPPVTPAAPQGDAAWDLCMDIYGILGDMVGAFGAEEFVESRRTAADRIRDLRAPTPSHQAALDDFTADLDALAQMVEDDPSTEQQGVDGTWEAYNEFVLSGGCDPA
jgi:hypothetical protein